MSEDLKKASQEILDGYRAAGVKDNEPFARVAAAQNAFALILGEMIDGLDEKLEAGVQVDRIELKRSVISVMTEAKTEFLKLAAKWCSETIVIVWTVSLIIVFGMGVFVGAIL